MRKDIIYNELVRQFEEGNNADNIINKKIDSLLVLSSLFIGYFFTVDNFVDIFIKGSVYLKHLFGFGVFFLLMSCFFTIRAFLIMKFKRGLKIDSVERITKRHSKIDVLTVINFALKETIHFNYERQKIKNNYFFFGFTFLAVSIILFIISKIIFSLS